MRMNEQSQMQDERENLSGSDLAECWYEETQRLLDDIAEITKTMKEDLKPLASRSDATITGKGN